MVLKFSEKINSKFEKLQVVPCQCYYPRANMLQDNLWLKEWFETPNDFRFESKYCKKHLKKILEYSS
jgi:hypothetical protein